MPPVHQAMRGAGIKIPRAAFCFQRTFELSCSVRVLRTLKNIDRSE
jgi:hypothetical protein